MAAKTGFYHAPHAKPSALTILKENEDGTVDIGTPKGVLVVGKCPIADSPKPGYFTVGKLPEPEKVESKTEIKTPTE
jgi:hypothetical protein